MRLKKYITEARRRTPKQWVAMYMENMFNNGDATEEGWGKERYRYKDWKDFFQGARGGAYDWSEDLYDNRYAREQGFEGSNDDRIDDFRDKILKVSERGFTKEKKLFNQLRKEDMEK